MYIMQYFAESTSNRYSSVLKTMNILFVFFSGNADCL